MSLEKDTMEIEDLKQLYRECDTFFICSTQNQIVNFIPIVNMLEAKAEVQNSSKVTIYNITYEKQNTENTESKSRNNKWDENLIRTLNECEECTGLLESGMKYKVKKEESGRLCTDIGLPRHYSQEKYRERIEDDVDWGKKSNNQTEKNIIWNLTGGQRNILLTVLKIIEEKATQNPNQKHTVLYMEGNTNRFVVGTYRQVDNGKNTNTHFEWNYKEIEEIYGWEHLTIEMVFGLAGFQAQCSKAIRLYKDQVKGFIKKRNKRAPYDESLHSDREEIKKFYKYYQDHDLVESLLITQTYDDKEKAKAERNKIWEQLKCKEMKDDVDRCKSLLEGIGRDTKYKLGYWLELMLYYELESIIKKPYQDYFLEIGHSVSLNPEGKGSKRDQFSEFDVVLLSKSGQVIIFECKSGEILSDDSKARMYTSYAAAGVYGMPILVQPYFENDGRVENNKEKIWEKMNTTRRVANRVNMDIWYLDTLEDNIDELYREVGLSCIKKTLE